MGHVVCMISDRRRLGEGAEAALIRRVAVAARAGVHLVQIRERDLSDAALSRLVAEAVEATHGTRARIVVNDRLDVAVASGAQGVHLRSDSVPAARVRAAAPHGFLIGRSVHSSEEAARVSQEGGLDYLMFGAIFETASKPAQVPAGLDALGRAVAAATTVPVLAVGGITAKNLTRLSGSHCAGFAAIGLFADEPESSLSRAAREAVALVERLG